MVFWYITIIIIRHIHILYMERENFRHSFQHQMIRNIRDKTFHTQISKNLMLQVCYLSFRFRAFNFHT